jgi:hypothetical protein
MRNDAKIRSLKIKINGKLLTTCYCQNRWDPQSANAMKERTDLGLKERKLQETM